MFSFKHVQSDIFKQVLEASINNHQLLYDNTIQQ